MSVSRVAALLELDPAAVPVVPSRSKLVPADLAVRLMPVRVTALRRPRTICEQWELEGNQRRRAIRAAEHAARALWARCAAPLDDVGCAAAIFPTADELLDLIFEPEAPPALSRRDGNKRLTSGSDGVRATVKPS